MVLPSSSELADLGLSLDWKIKNPSYSHAEGRGDLLNDRRGSAPSREPTYSSRRSRGSARP
jgi:hypothetical protein